LGPRRPLGLIIELNRLLHGLLRIMEISLDPTITVLLEFSAGELSMAVHVITVKLVSKL
jgi:hypothetical protein